ncbi:sugar transferase [Peribacillus asahii]|uniref:sugar transferase n=1 Tax=Peribacillus asahii TaxID=228899 RepID=UPI0037F1CBB7
MEKLAPIVLFVYNRPEKTYNTLQALKDNDLAKQSILYIFSDGPKNEEQSYKVEKVREIIQDVQGFKDVQVFYSNSNHGLANSVISGVSKIIKEYGKVIVLEDDLITSRYFLNFMNEALHFYKNNNKIWSISGYTPKIDFPNYYESDIYITTRACSWGWGTWGDRWEKIDWEIKDYHEFKKNKLQRKRFNSSGNDMSNMLDEQVRGVIDSWAIRWCFNQFTVESYTVYPNCSFIKNTGLIGDSTHGSLNKNFINEIVDYYDINFTNEELDNQILSQFSDYYNLKYYNYLGIILKRVGLYRKIKPLYKKYIARSLLH